MSKPNRVCVMCGKHDPPFPDDPEACPVSEREMGEGHGLGHLVAYTPHERAERIWERCDPIRLELGLERALTLKQEFRRA